MSIFGKGHAYIDATYDGTRLQFVVELSDLPSTKSIEVDGVEGIFIPIAQSASGEFRWVLDRKQKQEQLYDAIRDVASTKFGVFG